ncbi:EF hand domain-containing protein [Thioclava sp. ES.031]|uniref:EF-hand domain-containing protein n=1 Tax=Thioclava sp. ES.031 TaxID=1798203 RepID=UPI000BF8B9EB|nr:EF-hand domain-containing protein [Thioclava sp. ES.031]PFG65069.1 EF hand domain-containing protein [Thioclava sp. ES.031]
MKLPLLTATFLLAASAALAQTTPGDQFMQAWDLDGNGTATLTELQEMRGNVFSSFDANDDGALDAEEYVLFDEARAADVANYQNAQRAQMQKVADGMTLENSDLDGDGRVSRDEFQEGTKAWFVKLDKNGDDGITLSDFGMK